MELLCWQCQLVRGSLRRTNGLSPPFLQLATQHYAAQSKLVKALNAKTAGNKTAPPRYPNGAEAIRAASAIQPANSVGGVAVSRHLLSTAAGNDQGGCATHTAPTNALLLLDGAAIGAVADIMSVDADTASSSISVTLDVVHTPGPAVSEFTPHGGQTLDKNAHYHFFTPADVSVDAARFLKLVEGAAKEPAGGGVSGAPDQCQGQVVLCRAGTCRATTQAGSSHAMFTTLQAFTSSSRFARYGHSRHASKC